MEEEEERCQILRGRLSEGENIFFCPRGRARRALSAIETAAESLRAFSLSLFLSLFISQTFDGKKEQAVVS